MKIACIGNMNNIFFQIGRYLIDDNHQVTFFLLEEFDHFLPQADTYENINKYNIVKLGWNFDTFLSVTSKQIKILFSSFDYLIGTDLAPAYLFKAGLKLDIYFPHGSDLFQYPFFRYRNNPPQLWEIPANLTSRAQYLGIKEVDTVSLDVSFNLYEEPYKKIRNEKQKRICAPPFLYYKQYTDNYATLSTYYRQFQEIRNQYEFIVFQQVSQDWSMRGEFKLDKGNNHLIKGFADYLNKNEEYRKDSILILMEYGGDVEKSKQLISQLGISNNVRWFKKMNRKDLMVAIHFSDICVGELGYMEWYSYSCIMEFMAMKKPLIHHRGDDYYRSKGMDLYPMIDAKSAEEVTATFLDYRRNKQKYVQLGLDANKWVLADADKRVNVYKETILKKENNNSINFLGLKKIVYYLNPHIIYNYFFLRLYQLKKMIKG